MEQERTMEELIALINSQKGDFVIRVEFGEEAVSDAKEENDFKLDVVFGKTCKGCSDLFGAHL